MAFEREFLYLKYREFRGIKFQFTEKQLYNKSVIIHASHTKVHNIIIYYINAHEA